MKNILTAYLQNSIFLSVVALLVMAISPLLKRRYSANCRYYLWVTFFVAMIIPFRLSVNLPLPGFLKQFAPQLSTGAFNENSISTPVTQTANWEFLDYVCSIWLLGLVCFLSWHLLRHISFMYMARRWSEEVSSPEILAMFRNTKKELGIRQDVKLMTCACIKTPMMIGFIYPTVLLPHFEIPKDELQLILKHELIHFKRHDLWCKVLMLVTLSIHWFNPIVHIMLKITMDLCEISCDERVLKGENEKRRIQYGEAIIGVIRNGGVSTPLSTNFFTSIERVKSRVYAIMDTKTKRFSPILITTFVGISLLSMTAFAIAPETSVLEETPNKSTATDENNASLPQIDKQTPSQDNDKITENKQENIVTEKNVDTPRLVVNENKKTPENNNPKTLLDNTKNSEKPKKSENEQPQLIVSD
jgi:beta-lactamase regulating signal transducer with metallopeptidase domain